MQLPTFLDYRPICVRCSINRERTLELWAKFGARIVATGLPLTSGDRGPPAEAMTPAAVVSCPHLRPPTGELVPCEACPSGRTQLRVFGCEKFGTCVPTVSVAGRGFCGRCEHRPPAAGPAGGVVAPSEGV